MLHQTQSINDTEQFAGGEITPSNASEQINEDPSSDEKKEKEHDRKLIMRQMILYFIVGVTSALIELVLFQILYRFNILPIEPSNVIALVVATTYNFLLNGRLTFKTQENKLWCLVKYLILFAFNTTFTTFTIAWLVSIGWDSLIAKLGTMCCVVLWNFILYRTVIFK